MRKSLLIALAAAALGAVFVSAAAAGQNLPRVGGYRPVATNDPGVVAAARFAVKEQARKSGGAVKLISVDGAERQTVQGANYRLCLTAEVEDVENNVVVTENVRVVVYQDLKRQYSLRSWQAEDCAEED